MTKMEKMRKLLIVLVSALFITLAFSQSVSAEDKNTDECIYMCFNDQGNHTKVIDLCGSTDTMWDAEGTAVESENQAAVMISGRTITLNNYEYKGEGYTPQGENTSYGIYAETTGTLVVNVIGRCEVNVSAASDNDACGIFLDSSDVKYGLFIDGSTGKGKSELDVDVEGKSSTAFASYNIIFDGIITELNAEAAADGTGIGFEDIFEGEPATLYLQNQPILTAQAENAVFEDEIEFDFTKYDAYQKVTAGADPETAFELEIPKNCRNKPYVKIEPKDVGARLQVCFANNNGGTYFKDVLDGGAWDNYGNSVTNHDEANVIYDPQTNTLTLKNYEYDSIGGAVVGMSGVIESTGVFINTLKDETNIDIEGECSIAVTDSALDDCNIAGIYYADDGVLNITGKENASLTVDVYDGHGDSSGIEGIGGIALNSDSRTAKAKYIINGNSESTVNTKNSYGIISHMGDVSIKNSDIDIITGVAQFVAAGIRAAGYDSKLYIESSEGTIVGGRIIDGRYASDACGILASYEALVQEPVNNNDVNIIDSVMKIQGGYAKGVSRGIDLSGEVTISGEGCSVETFGSKTDTGKENYGIGSQGNINIEDSAQLDAYSPSNDAIYLYDADKDVKFDEYGTIPAAYVIKKGAKKDEYEFLNNPAKCAALGAPGKYRRVKVNPAELSSNTEKYTVGSLKNLTLKADVDSSLFSEIAVDGVELNSKMYRINGKNRVITVFADYMDTLDDGVHTFTVTWNTGFAGKVSLSKDINVSSEWSIKKCNVTLSKDTFVFNNKIQKPKVTIVNSKGENITRNRDYRIVFKNSKSRSVGTYTLVVKGIGNYVGTAKAKYVIRPRSKKIKALAVGKNRMTIKWKKSSKPYLAETTGYQIMYSEDASFEKHTTKHTGKKAISITITKLKADTTYYVKMRVYKAIGGQKYYSAWSKVKVKRTK